MENIKVLGNYTNLAYSIANSFYNSNINISTDDYYTAIIDRWIEVLKLYDEKRGNLTTFLLAVGNNAAKALYNKQKRHNNKLESLDEIYTNDLDDTFTLKEVVSNTSPSPEKIYINMESIAELEYALDTLSITEKYAVMAYFGLIDGISHSQNEIADKLHYSQSHVSRIIKEAIKKLRPIIEKHKYEYDDIKKLIKK